MMFSTIKQAAVTLHRRLLPDNDHIGVLPYFWLVYLGIFYLNFVFYDPPQWHYWAGLLGSIAFLVLYFRGYWVCGKELLLYIVLICGLGVLMSFINPGAGVFFVYASAFAAFVGTKKQGFAIIGGIVTFVVLYSWITEQTVYFYGPALLFSMLVGTVNIFQKEIGQKNAQLKLSEKEVQRLATTAERERIARDLHDLIGHTFSMITMKAQLAKKLFEHDQARAYAEIEELEQISRQALSDVREAVTGYKQKDLRTELANARLMLHSADIKFDYKLETGELEKDLDSTLAFIVREAVTNLVKHSKATSCHLTISKLDDLVTMQFTDNGQCPQLEEGNGLKGMRERVGELGGDIVFRAKEGFSIEVSVPV